MKQDIHLTEHLRKNVCYHLATEVQLWLELYTFHVICFRFQAAKMMTESGPRSTPSTMAIWRFVGSSGCHPCWYGVEDMTWAVIKKPIFIIRSTLHGIFTYMNSFLPGEMTEVVRSWKIIWTTPRTWAQRPFRKWFCGNITEVVFGEKNISKTQGIFVFWGWKGRIVDNVLEPPDVFLPLYSFIDSTHRKYWSWSSKNGAW